MLGNARHIVGMVVLLFVLLATVACGSSGSSQQTIPNQGGTDRATKLPKQLSFGTPGTGGTFYYVTVGISKGIEKGTGIKVNAEDFGANVQGWELIKAGEMELAMWNQFNAWAAYNGQEDFKENGPQPIRVLASGHISRYGLYTRKDSDIRAVTDLKGKKVAGTIGGFPVFKMATPLIIEAYGLKDGDVQWVDYHTIAEAKQALIEGKINAYFYPAGSHITEVDQAVGLRVVPIEADKVAYVQSKFSAFVPTTISAADYSLDKDYPALGWPAAIVLSDKMDEGLVYEITKAMYVNINEGKDVHPLMREWTLSSATSGASAPFHPGSVKYYKEAGVWTDKLEALQKEMLQRK